VTYSANAVYICLCSATAVGANCRRRSFSRGFVLHLNAIKLRALVSTVQKSRDVGTA